MVGLVICLLWPFSIRKILGEPKARKREPSVRTASAMRVGFRKSKTNRDTEAERIIRERIKRILLILVGECVKQLPCSRWGGMG